MKTFVAHFAHALNNSLAPLTGYLTLLGEEVQQKSPADQYLAKIQASMRRTEGFLEAVLQATHPERQFAPRRTDLAALLQRSLEGWMKALPAASEIMVTSQLAPCTASLDESQWTKVIQHLLRNAQTALQAGGTLEITLNAQILTAAQLAELGMTQPEAIRLQFKDTGCGMSEEVLRRACEPLFTTRAHGPTAGLGLTMAYSVCRLHGGQLVLESVEGSGTTVTCWLPASN